MTEDGSGAALRRVAAFDFDGTLSDRDTLVPFLARVAGRRRFAAVSAKLGLLGAGRRIPLSDRDRMKELMIRDLLGGMEEARLRELGEIYARDVLISRMNPAALERLHEHRRENHEVVFVSASLVYYLDPIARSLEVDAVIAVEPTSVNGILDGSLTHPNVRAEQKALRLAEWLEHTRTDDSDVQRVDLWAYGNSSGDHELLAMADHAFWLGSPRKVPGYAKQFTGDRLV